MQSSRSWTLGVAVLVVAALIALYAFDPARYVFMPKCPLKLLTGLSCPGCGFQRALHALLHGNFREAVGYNLFLVYAAPYAAAFPVTSYLLRGRAKQRIRRFIEHRAVVGFYVVTFCIWFVVRNVLGI